MYLYSTLKLDYCVAIPPCLNKSFINSVTISKKGESRLLWRGTLEIMLVVTSYYFRSNWQLRYNRHDASFQLEWHKSNLFNRFRTDICSKCDRKYLQKAEKLPFYCETKYLWLVIWTHFEIYFYCFIYRSVRFNNAWIVQWN